MSCRASAAAQWLTPPRRFAGRSRLDFIVAEHSVVGLWPPSPRGQREKESIPTPATECPATVVPVNSTKFVNRKQLSALLARVLANCWLGNEAHIEQRISKTVGRKLPWMNQLAKAACEIFGEQGRIGLRVAHRWLARSEDLSAAFRGREKIAVAIDANERAANQHPPWPVAKIPNKAALADFLTLRSTVLIDWLVLPHVRRETTVDHYQRRSFPKKSGKTRWIEEPKPVLKRVQRIIARHLLPDIPTHESSHGFVRDRSTVSGAKPHVGKRVVLRMDMVDFFGSISLTRVAALFRNAGYELQIAVTLARLCTAPALKKGNIAAGGSLTKSRLPQGAPTSPGIANAVAFALDRRLAGLAQSFAANYTRYADDLIFSGNAEFAARLSKFQTFVAAIVLEEGFEVNFHKTRRMFSGGKQRVLGWTVNQTLNSDRREYETLRAILHNCVKNGWRSQNHDNLPAFREHLLGRIAHIHRVNPNRAAKLRKTFYEINWSHRCENLPENVDRL